MKRNRYDKNLDEFFERACRIVVSQGETVKVGYLQRCLKIGFIRAINIVSQMQRHGIVGKPAEGGGCELLITSIEELERLLSQVVPPKDKASTRVYIHFTLFP